MRAAFLLRARSFARSLFNIPNRESHRMPLDFLSLERGHGLTGKKNNHERFFKNMVERIVSLPSKLAFKTLERRGAGERQYQL